jgi:hypothetical protein
MTNELTCERIEKVKKNVCISLDSLADENGEVVKSHKDDLSTILALANAELERQNVTDELIERAVRTIECYKNREQKEWEDDHTNWVCIGVTEEMHDEVMADINLAIQALQAYRPEREPCEHCRPRKAWEVPNDGIYAYQEVNTLGEIQGWSLSVYGGMICFGNAQGRPTYIANCPMCGRRLEY